MPTRSVEEIRALIAQASIGGIAIDTSIFDRSGCNLESPIFVSVAELTPRHVTVLMPDIIAGEVRNHIVRDVRTAVDHARKSILMVEKSRGSARGAFAAAGDLLELDVDAGRHADARIRKFVELTKAEVLAATDWLDPAELLARYLEPRPPFEAAGKKSEFPDAIALIELERWGAKREQFVLAVSDDNGWTAYAQDAAWVIVTKDLPAALALFQEAENELVERVAAHLRSDGDSDIAAMIGSSLERHVDNLVPSVEARSFARFEASFVGAEVVGWAPVDSDEIKVISSGAQTVTLSFPVEVTIEAEAEFSFAHYDSTDNAYVPLGGASVIRVLALQVPFLAEVGRVNPENNVVTVAAEERRLIELDFGNVEPNFERD
jgi:hypothetical protein